MNRGYDDARTRSRCLIQGIDSGGGMLKRIFNKLSRLLVQNKRRKTFGSFGHNVTLMKPFMVTRPEHIYIEDNVFIRDYARIEAITTDGINNFKPTIIIRKGTHIEQYFHLGCCTHVEICENVLIAGRVYISDHNHEFSDVNRPILAQGVKPGGKVVIKENAWLGEGCAILPGVTVGKNSIIGTNSVVTHDIPDYSIAVGIPAKVIKTYNHQSGTWEACK